MLKKIFLVLGVLGACAVGISLVADAVFDAGVAMARVVSEALTLSSEPRVVVDVACRERRLLAGQQNASLGLDPPAAYKGSYTSAVRLAVVNESQATVSVELQAVKPFNVFDPGVRAGETIVFAATCDEGRISWTVSGTASEPHRNMASAGRQQAG